MTGHDRPEWAVTISPISNLQSRHLERARSDLGRKTGNRIALTAAHPCRTGLVGRARLAGPTEKYRD